MLLKKEKDSLISHKVFTQFMSDSVFRPVFAKGVNPKSTLLERQFLMMVKPICFKKAITNDKKAMYVIAVDKKKKFQVALTALRMDQSNITR